MSAFFVLKIRSSFIQSDSAHLEPDLSCFSAERGRRVLRCPWKCRDAEGMLSALAAFLIPAEAAV